MKTTINAACTACGATFPRESATTEFENMLSCPSCGCSVIRAIPSGRTALTKRANIHCASCGATFPRHRLNADPSCPVCGTEAGRTTDTP